MKAALLVGILAVATALSAQSRSAPEPQNRATEIAAQANSEAVLEAQLIRGLDARKAESGDPVIARCQQDLKSNGEVLIPKNAKLVGHVVAAQAKGHGKAESTLEITFDKAIMRDGREIPLRAAIQALAPPPMMADEDGERGFRIRNAPAAKPRTSALLPGGIKTSTDTATITVPIFSSDTTGVVGLNGLQLESGTSGAIGSVIHSSSQNVRLESGTRLILRVSLP